MRLQVSENSCSSNFHTEIGELQSAIAAKKVEIQNAQTLIDKYTAQQNNVRNNREFDFLTQRELNSKLWKSNFVKNVSKSFQHRKKQKKKKK